MEHLQFSKAREKRVLQAWGAAQKAFRSMYREELQLWEHLVIPYDERASYTIHLVKGFDTNHQSPYGAIEGPRK